MRSLYPTVAPEETHPEWIPLLELATREVFELMLSSRLTVPASNVAFMVEKPEITAMVGLAGRLCGVLSINCDHKSAALVISKMLGVNPENADPQLSDAMGEIANMVAGNFKNKVAGLGDDCMLSTPTVITGGDYSLHSLGDSVRLEVRLLFDSRPVTVTLQVHS
jgi:chemotaxis protein CheX